MSRMPALFLSHGSPVMALKTADIDAYVRELSLLGKRLPIPRAICLVSAHWYVKWKYVSVSEHPETIHDFWGFPRELYEIRYPCPGFPEWADLLRDLFPDIRFVPMERGIDHGGWTVLMHLFPEADIPVFSISIDATDTPEKHFALWEKLWALRDHGIMIIATGNIVHNLSNIDFGTGGVFSGTDQAKLFDRNVKNAIEVRDYAKLFDPWCLSGGKYSVPTIEHYLPLLTILWAADPTEKPVWIFEGYELWSISRRAVGFFG